MPGLLPPAISSRSDSTLSLCIHTKCRPPSPPLLLPISSPTPLCVGLLSLKGALAEVMSGETWRHHKIHQKFFCLLGGGLPGMRSKAMAIGSTIAIVASSILQVSDAIPTASSLSHVGMARTSLETLERGLAWERARVRNSVLQRGGGGRGSMRLRGGLGAEEEEWVDTDAIILSAPVEKAIAMVEKYAVVGVIWAINVELLWRGSLRRALGLVLSTIFLGIKLCRIAFLILLLSWAAEKAKTAIISRIPPPMRSSALAYPPRTCSSLGSGKYIVGGGGGAAAPGRPNKATLMVEDAKGILQAAEIDFGDHPVEALAFHKDIGIVCHTGCQVHRLRASGKGKKYNLARGRPLQLPTSDLESAFQALTEEYASDANNTTGGSLCFSPSGELLAASMGTKLQMWRSPPTSTSNAQSSPTFSSPRSPRTPEKNGNNSSLHGSFRHLASFGANRGPRHKTSIFDLAINKQGTLLISVDSYMLAIWDTDSHEVVAWLTPDEALDGFAESESLTGTRFTGLTLIGNTVFVSVATQDAGGFLMKTSVSEALKPQRVVRVSGDAVTCLGGLDGFLACGTEGGDLTLLSAERMRIIRTAHKVHTMPVSRVTVNHGGEIVSLGYDNVFAKLHMMRSTDGGPYFSVVKSFVDRAKKVMAASMFVVDMLLEAAGRKAGDIPSLVSPSRTPRGGCQVE